jgi:superfamily II DNA or RNA helicase
MTIREAVEEGLLCSVSSVIVKTQTDISKVDIANNGDFDEKTLKQAINISVRNAVAVDFYKQEFNNQLTVAYCVGVEHAEAVAREFSAQGVPAAAIYGTLPRARKKELLAQFHNGEIKVLCNADLLIQGFDEKQASVCLNLRPTRSKIVTEQRGGRVLRLNEKDKAKHATIVEFMDKGYEDNGYLILFADVAEGASFYPKVKHGGGGVGGEGRKRLLLCKHAFACPSTSQL